MMPRKLAILVMAAAMAMGGCAINDAGPAEFSFDRITVSNPIGVREDTVR